MSRVVVTRNIPQPGIDRLKQVFSEVEVFPYDRDVTKAELIDIMKGCDVLLCLLTSPIDKEVIDSNPNLKGICNYAVGFNNIDISYANSKGIIVCNTPDVLTETTADLTWALIMSACRRVLESDKLMRSGTFSGWEPMMMLGRDIYGKTLGIIGMGRIGQAVAMRATGFGMRIIYNKHSGPASDLPFKAEFVEFETLLKEADIISIHTPLTPQTRHLIGYKELAMMKRTTVLINTARGPIIDEKALVKALKNGDIFAAGLDVYENEPKMEDGLADLPNVVLLPHIGSATIETRTAMSLLAAENAIAIMQGKKPPTPITIV
jgi:glyoxylate reductase